MRITFSWWHWLTGRNSRVVYIATNQNGSWSKHSQRDLIVAMKETKGIEVEDA